MAPRALQSKSRYRHAPSLRKPSRPLDLGRNGYRNWRALPRRFTIAIGLACLVLFILLLSSSSSAPTSLDELRESYHQGTQQAKQLFRDSKTTPSLYNPFAIGIDAQKPPEQHGARRGLVKWLSHANWRMAFSGSITLDNERVLLPPLTNRTVIYTYHNEEGQPKEVSKAEEALVQSWHRAWWAKGFQPVVLGKSDMRKHKLHQNLKDSTMRGSVRGELERWLAWSQAGGGILCSSLAFPMAPLSDRFLQQLGQKNFSSGLTRFESLRSALYVGSKDHVDTALEYAFKDLDKLDQVKSIHDAFPLEMFEVSSTGAGSIAYYDDPTVRSTYGIVADRLASSRSEGLVDLSRLINGHLHTAWQNAHHAGVRVVHTHPEHMTALTSFSSQLAQFLTSCPQDSPLPESCPPSNPKCKPCLTNAPAPTLADRYTNNSQIFQIVPVPHPLTLTSLTSSTEAQKLDVRYIRRKTRRDTWLEAVMEGFVAEGLGGQQRLVPFKEAVTSSEAAESALFLIAEHGTPLDLSYALGFELDLSTEEASTSSAELQSRLYKAAPAKQPAMRKSKAAQKKQPMIGNLAEAEAEADAKFQHKEKGTLAVSDVEVARERQLIQGSQQLLNGKVRDKTKVQHMVEGWNLADTEAWRFVRAFEAMREKEKEDWEKHGKGLLDEIENIIS